MKSVPVEKWEKNFVETGAALEHARWARWQKYLHSRGIVDNKGEGYLCIPMGLIKHWERQIETPYSELSESEKESDRKEAREYLPLLSQAIQAAKEETEKEGDERLRTFLRAEEKLRTVVVLEERKRIAEEVKALPSWSFGTQKDFYESGQGMMTAYVERDELLDAIINKHQ